MSGVRTHKCEFEVFIGRLGLYQFDGILEDVRVILLQEEHSLDLEIYSCDRLLIRDHSMMTI